MGLRFRKSVTLCKGVKLNFGKTGMSITTGMPGFHKTYNFGTGKTTTSIGLPGTGLSYVTTSGGSKRKSASTSRRSIDSYYEQDRVIVPDNTIRPQRIEPVLAPHEGHASDYVPVDTFVSLQDTVETESEVQLDESIKTIHYLADETIDWTELLIADHPDDDWTDLDFWKYCHDKAYKVLNGDIDTYLELIQDINPLDDLLGYGVGFECGTDNPNSMTVEFTTKQKEIMPPFQSMPSDKYYDLLQDYICSCSIRVARDIFALLPVSNVVVHAVSDDDTVLSVVFERRTFSRLKFQGTDASELVSKFKNNMSFDPNMGFSPVDRIDV